MKDLSLWTRFGGRKDPPPLVFDVERTDIVVVCRAGHFAELPSFTIPAGDALEARPGNRFGERKKSVSQRRRAWR